MASTTRSALLRTGCVAAALALGALVAGCGGDQASERMPLGQAQGMGSAGEAAEPLPRELQQELDSGNEAFRARDYESALRHFQAAVDLEPGLAAGWYGIGMVQQALGNPTAADSAMTVVHRLAPHVPLRHPGPETPAPPNPHPVRDLPSDGEGEES